METEFFVFVVGSKFLSNVLWNFLKNSFALLKYFERKTTLGLTN